MKTLDRLSVLVVAVSSLICCRSVAAGQYIDLGPASGIALDQPRVAVEVYVPQPEQSFGPEFFNTFLLDTGSQGILAQANAYADLADAGYQVEGTFYEQGVSGTIEFDVSAVYNFRFAGTDGTPHTLENVRIMSHETMLCGFDGIVGMPAMVDRVTTMDLRPMEGIDLMEVAFSDTLPADNGHRYSVPLELVDWPAPPQEPGALMPTYGPIPFMQATLGHGSQSATGTWLLDTGAQMTIVSTAFALAAGLDESGDGSLDDEVLWYEQICGVGGTTPAPVIAADRLVVPTAEGVDLVWTDLYVLVLDIDPDIDGVFSCDPLTSGYLERLGTGEYGYFEQVHLQFSDDGDNTNDMMYLDMNGTFDNVVPEPACLGLLGLAVVAVTSIRRRGGRLLRARPA